MHLQLRSVVAISASLLCGAAVATEFSIPAPTIPRPLIQPLPVKIGLCLSPLLQATRLRQVKNWARLEVNYTASGQAQTWQLGNALVSTLATATRAAFAEVVLLDACTPDAALPQDMQAILVPELLQAESPIRWNWSDVSAPDSVFHPARIELRMTLRSAKGTSVSWNISGAAALQIKFSTKRGDEEAARALSAALFDACARFIADLYRNREVRTWLTDLNATSEGLE